MKLIRRTTQFKHDIRRMKRQGRDIDKLKRVLQTLVEGKAPGVQHREHTLVGQYRGTRECHIEPDWLLIYESADTELVLIRTGTHSDLFA